MSEMKHKRRLQSGFTLIEVIVALTLFSISILVLTQSFVNGLMCKNNLSKENTRPLVCHLIRDELKQLERDNVAVSHTFFLPDNQTKISWQGSVEFCEVSSLYKVKVKIKELDEDFTFWISRPDWMTTQEKATVLSFVQKEEREDVEL